MPSVDPTLEPVLTALVQGLRALDVPDLVPRMLSESLRSSMRRSWPRSSSDYEPSLTPSYHVPPESVRGPKDRLRAVKFCPDNYRVEMPRPPNPSRGERFEVTLSAQSINLLRQLATRGLYGRTPAEVGGRFIEQALQQFVQPPRLSSSIGRSSSGKTNG